MKWAAASISIMLGVIVLEMSVNPFRTLLLGIALAAGAEELKMKDLSEATFAGGCFWCLQPAFDNLEGVASTSVGYTGGKEKEPNYEDVAYGRTGHREAIRVKYDPDKVGYEKLLDTFWKSINPTQADGQFADIGPHYRTAIFYHDQKQREAAEKSKGELSASGKFDKPIATEILPASEFYAAEGYHQEYYKKNPGHYERYKIGSGRAGYIEKTWGKE